MTALLADVHALDFADADATLLTLAERLKAGKVVPYLGPGLLALTGSELPVTPETLAEFLGSKVSLPARARGNAWAAAQFIESRRHRATVTALMAEAFAGVVEPSDLHRHLASLDLPLIVDSWYDGAMRRALAGRTGWGEIQGITRAGIREDLWYRYYDPRGDEADKAAARGWTTVLYKPHGAIDPVQNFLISDADYVETLTEIDIQTPIPDEVKDRRSSRGFLFLGCRFHDQLLRTYARQVLKRAGTGHVAVFDPADALTRNELRFLVAEGITPVSASLRHASDILLQVA
jgi:hypothetical protein